MPSEEISAVSTPYCGRADAMEFSSRAVAARHRMASREEPHGYFVCHVRVWPTLISK